MSRAPISRPNVVALPVNVVPGSTLGPDGRPLGAFERFRRELMVGRGTLAFGDLSQSWDGDELTITDETGERMVMTVRRTGDE